MPVLFPDIVAEIAFETDPAAAYIAASFTMVTSANSYWYQDMTSVTDYVVQAGDALHFDLWWEDEDAEVHFDFTCSDGSLLRTSGRVDDFGHPVLVGLNDYAVGKWLRRTFKLTGSGGTDFASKTITNYDLLCESNVAGQRRARFRNIVITDGFGTIRKVIWHPVQPLPTFALHYESGGGQSYAAARLFDDPVWEDVTPWLLEAHPRHGRRKPLERCEPGTCPVILDNADRRFDSENHASPYWPNIVTGRRMRIHVRHYYELLKADGAASIWRLNEASGDAVGDSVGDAEGTATAGATHPTFGSGSLLFGDDETTFSFDGGDLIAIGDRYRFSGNTPFSVSAYIYPTLIASDGARRHVIANLRSDGGGLQGWALSILNKRIRVSRHRNGVEQFAEYATDLVVNTIYHVTATYDGTSLRLYINEALQDTEPSAQALVDLAGALTIGNRSTGGEAWSGRLSSIALWEFPLSAEAVKGHNDKAAFAFNDGVFDGFIEDWPQGWRGRLPEVNITLSDAFASLEQASISGFRAIELSGSRISWALNQANDPGARAIDPGRSQVEQSASATGTLLDNDPTLEHLLVIAEAESGLFFIDRNGVRTFHDRLRRLLSAGFSMGTFANDPDTIDLLPPGGVRGKDYYGVATGWPDYPNFATDMAHISHEDITTGVPGMGARLVRVDIPWAYTESPQGTFDWSDNDDIVEAIEDKGMQAVLLIQTSPAWARPGGTTDKWGPDTLARRTAYAEFCYQVVKRYKPGGTAGTNVRYFEVWNEPNLPVFWEASPVISITNPNWLNFTLMLQLAYRRIKEADPDAIVISGGLAAHGKYGDGALGINQMSFLEGMYDSGALDYFDVFGYHPYDQSWEGPPGDATGVDKEYSGWSTMADTSPSLRSIMSDHGDGYKLLWGTEFGYPRTGAGSLDDATIALRVTEAYARWKTYPWAGPLLWYNHRDIGQTPAFGLMSDEWVHRAGWTAYQASVGETDDDQPGTRLLAIDIHPTKSRDDVLNDIRLRPIAATTDAVAVDLDSQLRYGLRSLPRTVWLTSLTECQSQAEWLLAQFRESKQGFDQLTIDPKRDPVGLVPQVLHREISERVTVMYRMSSGEPGEIDIAGPVVTRDCHIEGVEHDIVTRDARWTWETRWALSPAETQTYWILGDAENSLLGVSTVLGY